MFGIRRICKSRKFFTRISHRPFMNRIGGIRTLTFVHSENGSVYDLLRSWPEYNATFFDSQPLQSPDKWKEFKPVVQEFKEVLSSAVETTFGEDFEPSLVSSLLSEKTSFTDEELQAVLYATSLAPIIPKPKAEVFHKLWTGLDEVCVARAPSWDMNTRFLTADLWHKLQVVRMTDFHWYLIKRLFRKCDKLSKVEYIRFMFCLNLAREVPKAIVTYELEHSLLRLEETLNPEEICIVAMAFFKCESRLRDHKLLERLVEKAMTKSKDLDSILVAALAKFTRICIQSRATTNAYRIQDVFIPEISRLSFAACTHLALVGSMARVFHKKLLELVLERCEAELEHIRLKEIERLLLCVTMFDMDCDSLCRKVITLLESPAREREVDNYGRSLSAIAYYISLRQIYPYDLISKVLSTEFLEKYYGKNMQRYQRELLCLDYTMGLECPDYTGNRLSERAVKSISKFNIVWLWPPSRERVSAYENNVRLVSSGLSEFLGGENFVYACNILPQFATAEVVIRLDKNNQPVEIPQSFRDIPDYVLKPVPKELNDPNINFHVVLVGNPNFCAVNDPRMILAQNRLQIRQLSKIGYTVHMIMPHEFINIRKYTETERKEFYNQLLFGNSAAEVNESQSVSAVTS